ncbi:MAG: FAD-dependent oxidoreductase [Pseudomonadota bacterium]
MAGPPPEVNYTFNDKQIEQLKAYGEVRSHPAGAPLFQEGDRRVDCMVVLSGQLDINVADRGDTRRVGWMEPGQFAGDLAVLTGQAALAAATMAKAGDVLHIPHARFQRLLVENSELSDIFVRAFTARRGWAQSSGHASVMVIGDRRDRSVFAIRDLLAKHGVPHAWIDADADPLAERVMATQGFTQDDLPIVARGASSFFRKPTVSEISDALGLDLLPDGACADVIVVGAGPGGLAASVYAASEGLTVLTLDTDGPGGQAGTSSKIENYLGFPMGVSGRELAERAAIQAQKFGVRIAAPAKAAALNRKDEDYCLQLADGRSFLARAVVIATGAQYRKLPIENLERFEGRGVYYGATPMEAQLCAGSSVAIVGAGNSAGQGAVFLAQTAKEVHVLYRRPDIRETMSEYLVRRLEEAPNIHLHPSTEISRFVGSERAADPDEDFLNRIEITKDGASAGALDTPFAFLFVGAAPFTRWLPEEIASDDKGFLKTGPDLANLDLVKAGWRLDRMPTRFETSWPRVYAVGDVRTGSVKRVASAVGEGSVVVSDVHRALGDD